MKTWTVFWRTGQREIVKGANKAAALTSAGYSAGAVAAIDFIADGDCNDYRWDPTTREWNRTK